MKDNKAIAEDIYKIIIADPRAAISFFDSLKDTQIFLSLNEVGLFDNKLIPGEEKTKNGTIHKFWAQAIYLEYIAKQIQAERIKDIKYIEIFLKRVRRLCSERINTSVMSSVFRIITFIPAKYLEKKDIDLIFELVPKQNHRNTQFEYLAKDGLESFLNHVDSKPELEIVLYYVKLLFSIRIQKKSTLSSEELLFFDDYRLQKFFYDEVKLDEMYKKSPDFLFGFIEVLINLLQEILSELDLDSSSQYWRPAIENHGQNRYHDSAQSVYSYFIYVILDFLSDKVTLDNFLDRLRVDKFITMKRIFLACVTKFGDKGKVIEASQMIISCGLSSGMRYEIYHFLNKKFDSLDDSSQEEVIGLITSLKDEYSESKDEQAVFDAWKKIRWLEAIKDSNNTSVQEIYAECLKLTGNSPEHPDFSVYSSNGWVGPESPFSKEELSKLSGDKLLETIVEYVEEDTHMKPTKRGLSRALEEFVSAEPLKSFVLVENMEKLDFIYISSVFDGYKQSWSDNRYVPLSELLLNFEKIQKSKNFESGLEDESSKKLWAITSFLRFLKAGLRDDDNAFDLKFNQRIFEILSTLSAQLVPTGETVSPSDAYTRAINEPRGVFFETVILWALRATRNTTENLEKEAIWSQVHSLIDSPARTLTKDEVSLHALVGAYYRQFLYLNEEWLYDYLSFISDNSDKSSHWLSFMEGFGYVTVFVEDIYKVLIENDMLISFLRYDIDDKSKESRVDRLQGRGVELILIAYILGVDDIDSGGMKKILDFNDSAEINNVLCSIERVIGKERKPEYLARGINLIKVITSRLTKIINDEILSDYANGIGRTLKLARSISDDFIDEVIEVKSRISEGYWDMNSVIDFLHEYRDENPVKLSELFLKVVENSKSVPTYPKDKIEDLFDILKTSNRVNFAKICRIYQASDPYNKELSKYWKKS